MPNLYMAAEYKNKIINFLLANEDFIKLIAPIPSEYEELDIIDVLLGGRWVIDGKDVEEQGHVFDYNFADDVISDERTFVFVDTDIESVYRSSFLEFSLLIFVFTAKPLVRLTDTTTPTVQEIRDMGYFAGRYANRIDILCDIIDRTLNGNKKIPGVGTIVPAERNHVLVSYPNNKYYGKRLKYTIKNLNEVNEDECYHR